MPSSGIQVRNRCARLLAGVGVGAAVTAVCPVAGAVLGVVGFVRACRKVALTEGNPEALAELLLSAGDVASDGKTQRS